MLRKRTPQDAPLLDRQGSSLGSQPGVGLSGLNDDDSAVELRLTASCNGALGSVKIYTDASFSFSPHEVLCTLHAIYIARFMHAHCTCQHLAYQESRKSLHLHAGHGCQAKLAGPSMLQRGQHLPSGESLFDCNSAQRNFQTHSKSRNVPSQVEGQDVVGATLTGSQGFQVWFCSKASRSQQKPVRYLTA